MAGGHTAAPNRAGITVLTGENVFVEGFGDGLVRVHHVYPEAGRIMNGALWLRRAHAGWLAHAALDVADPADREVRALRQHDDDLRVLARGSDVRPVVQIRNRRPAAAVHSGMWVLLIDARVVPLLAAEFFRVVG